MSIGSRVDPAPGHWFEVDMGVPGLVLVREVSGLSETLEIVKVYEGGTIGAYHPLPGKRSWKNLILKGVVAEDLSFFAWYSSTRLEFLIQARRMLSIFLKRSDGKIMANWNVIGAYPISYTGPTFDSNSAKVAFEQIELTHMGIIRDL
jgi:phage tail-like protein